MFRCPRCGSSEYLVVDLQVHDARVDAQGNLVEVLGDARFDSTGRMHCGECKFDGRASDFGERAPRPGEAGTTG